MRLARCGARTFVVVITAIVLASPACSGGGSTGGSPDGESASDPSTIVIDGQEVPLVPATVPEPRVAEIGDDVRAQIEDALVAGAEFGRTHDDESDPAVYAFYDYIWRNWGVQGLEAARATAESLPRPSEPAAAQFLRLIHPDDPMPDVGPDEPVNPMLLALHCDQSALPPDFADLLADLVRAGAPADLGIAAFAIIWAGELGCDAPDLTALADATVDALAVELRDRTDVDHEGVLLGVGLIYLGRADLIPAYWVSALLDAQADDGGWSETLDGPSSWRTTAMALWVLAGSAERGAGVPLVLVG